MAEQVPRGPQDRPFWVRAQVDLSGLNAVVTVGYALARRRGAEGSARRFSDIVRAAAASMLQCGEVTMNLWEEPDSVVCRLAGAENHTTVRLSV